VRPFTRAAIVPLAAFLSLVPAFATAALTIDAPPQLRATAERLRAVDLQPLDDALRRAGLSLPGEIRIELIHDDDARARSVPEWIVGLAFGERDVVIFPGRVVSYPYDSLESVLRHEITHLALNAAAGGRAIPRWFHEGVATSVDAGWGIGAQVRLTTVMIARSDAAALERLFASGLESEAREAYLLSAVLIHDLRRRHGDETPGSMARRVAEGASFDQAFADETGETSEAAAARAWDAYRRWTAWIPAMTSATATWALILVLAFVAYAAQLRRRWRRRRQWDEEEGTPTRS
jgi:hypothetical protein